MGAESAKAVDDGVELPRFRDAYEQRLAEIRAVEAPLAQVTTDLPTAVTTVLGALPEIRAMRPRIVEELPKFDLARFDRLESITLAMAHAHTIYMAASAQLESLPELLEKCARLRELFASDAQALALRGLLDATRVKGMKSGVGYRQTAFDLFALAQILRESWSKIEGKTALTLSELNQAEQLADRLATAVGEREQAPAAVNSAEELRQRAFTFFILAYKDARRAIRYLAEDELDRIAPSVYIPRGPGRKRSESGEQLAIPSPIDSADGPESEPSAQVAPRTGSKNGAPIGMPGSNPFTE